MTQIRYLDPYSIEDTKDFISKLETEIVDLKQQIKKKKQYQKIAYRHIDFLKKNGFH